MNRASYIQALVLLAALLCARPATAGEAIVLGMSADFSGPARSLGVELWRGAALYLDEVNRQGGIHDRPVRILALDDGYAPDPAIANTVRLVEKDDVFALFNYVGTPTATRILPLLKRYAARNVFLLTPLSGTHFLRQPPYDQYVFNLRASYAQETRALVDRFLAAGRTRIAVFYQVDSFGRSAWSGVRAALAESGLAIAAEATYRRGSGFATDMRPQVRALARVKPEAVIAAGTAEAVAAFVRDAQALGLDAPVAVLSFAPAGEVQDILRREHVEPLAAGLIGSLTTPSHEDETLPAVRDFKRLLAAHPPSLPPGLVQAPCPAPSLNPVAFEGFLNAKLVVEVLRRLGPQADQAGIPKACREAPFDLGIGPPACFAPGCNQALSDVYFVSVEPGGPVPISDFGRWRK
ncbi:ABC transporter substrate-binding protein [Desulfocurvus sp. DL9XJH121]